MPIEKRVDDLILGLAPEEKARLLLEDQLCQPVFSDEDCRKILSSMNRQETQQYTDYWHRFERLRSDTSSLVDLTQKIQLFLLHRDRFLWFHRALVEVVQAISFDLFNSGASRILLTDNPALEADKAIEIKVPFATVRLGVSGPERIPVDGTGGVELSPEVEEVLDTCSQRIKELVIEAKPLHCQVIQEAREMGLAFIGELADFTVEQARGWDQPTLTTIMEEIEERREQWDKEGLSEEEQVERILDEGPQSRGMGVFPVEERWALEWELIDEVQSSLT